LDTIPLFSLTREVLEKVPPPEKEVIIGLVEEIKTGFHKLFEAPDPQKYPKAPAHMENFYQRALLKTGRCSGVNISRFIVRSSLSV
jgi:hypothetical protein